MGFWQAVGLAFSLGLAIGSIYGALMATRRRQ